MLESEKQLWCKNQTISDSDVICLAHLAEGRAPDCPYSNYEDLLSSKYPCADFEIMNVDIMKRLTYRMSNGAAMLPCTSQVDRHKDYEEAIERLAQYEDSDLTPEDFKNIADEYIKFKVAEFEQRLVILTCEPGTTVYRIYTDCNSSADLCMMPCKGCKHHVVSIIEEKFTPFNPRFLNQKGEFRPEFIFSKEEAEAKAGELR